MAITGRAEGSPDTVEDPTMNLSKIALIATATLTLVASFTAPALATDQRTAVGLCIDQSLGALSERA